MNDGEDDRLIAEWPKGNGGDVIRVILCKYRGNDMIAVRVWKPNPGGQDLALKNGINLKVEHLPKLIKALRQARKKADKAELL
jgi:hypothetical protein